MKKLTTEELTALVATAPATPVEVRHNTHFLRGTTAEKALEQVESREIPCAEMSEHAFASMPIGIPYAIALLREAARQSNPNSDARARINVLAWTLEACLLIGVRPLRPANIRDGSHPYLSEVESWQERAEAAMVAKVEA